MRNAETANGCFARRGAFVWGQITRLLKKRIAREEAGKELQENEEKYRLLVEACHDAIFIQSNGVIVFVNSAAVNLFGAHGPEQLIGRKVIDLIHPDYRQIVLKRIRVLKELRCSVPLQKEKYLCLDGTSIDVEVRASASLYRGQPAIQVIARDISERLRTNEELAEWKEFLGTVINAISDPIFVKDIDHRRVLINDSYCRFMGRSRDELIGKSDYEICPRPLAEDLTRRDKCVFESGREKNAEETLTDAAGSARTFLTKKCLHHDKKGNRFIVGIARDITGRKEMEELLLRAKTEWEETFDTIDEAITVHDTAFNILRANKAAEKILDLPVTQISNRKCYELFHGADRSPGYCASCEVLKTGKPASIEMFEPHLNKFIQLKALPRFDSSGRIIGIVHITRDITRQKEAEEEQKKLQTQFIHAQKMESVGRLASGIAHDFNNILSTIISYSELALLDPPRDEALKERLKIINESGEKAAELTRQLLAFSRRQVLEMKALDLKTVIMQMAKMLRRMIGEDIILELNLKAAPSTVLADKNQIEQVLMNLTVNARDAMPEGGRLIIETSRAEIEENFTRQRPEMKAGSYVVIAVSDTGIGMSSAIREKIFEPFFTTKGIGKGTGLGLATVYGIIKQHNGFIYVYSEPGSGATFKIYLPLVTADVAAASSNEAVPLAAGTETIMIVDDELSIRRLVGDTLRPLGYKVLEAANGLEALELTRARPENIHLVLTDVIMPGMTGKELAHSLQRERPGIKVIFMSGYTDDMIVHHGVLNKGVNFIQKPVTPSVLTKKLREVLGNRKIS